MYMRLSPDEKDHPVLPRLRVLTKKEGEGPDRKGFWKEGREYESDTATRIEGSASRMDRRTDRTEGPSFCVLQHFSQVEYVSAVHREGGREG